MTYVKWILFFPLNLAIELVAYTLNPLVALLPTTYKLRKDYVKILGKEVEMFREHLIKPVYWFQSHDNAVDEYWYGGYYRRSIIPEVRMWQQSEYDNNWWIRYFCRLMWMMRNNAYGFSYNLFGAPLEEPRKPTTTAFIKRPYSWQYKKNIKLWGGYYTSINIGWKANSDMPRLMYAGRIFGGFRK